MQQPKKPLKRVESLKVKPGAIVNSRRGTLGKDGNFYKNERQAKNIGEKTYNKEKRKTMTGDYNPKLEAMDKKRHDNTRHSSGKLNKHVFNRMKKNVKRTYGKGY